MTQRYAAVLIGAAAALVVAPFLPWYGPSDRLLILFGSASRLRQLAGPFAAWDAFTALPILWLVVALLMLACGLWLHWRGDPPRWLLLCIASGAAVGTAMTAANTISAPQIVNSHVEKLGGVVLNLTPSLRWGIFFTLLAGVVGTVAAGAAACRAGRA